MPSQIPFEREWDLVVQAYDEATVALKEDAHVLQAQGVPGTHLQPSAKLAAEPLTANSLQRALAPVNASSAASVLHLSAHGANGCLVADDGKCTAHFLDCDTLQEMLELR